jgi:predicted secreted protein
MTPIDAGIAEVLHYVIVFGTYGLIWFFFLFVLLPLPFGSPRDPETGMLLRPQLGRKALWAAIAAAPVWIAFYAAIRVGTLRL